VIRKLTVMLLVGVICLLGVTSALAIKYNEAPTLRTRVAAGELPPVEERLPESPYVVTPVEEIGQYGGTLRLVSIYATVPVGAGFVQDVLNGLVQPNLEGELLPHFATKVESSNDKTTYTIHLRKGVKWSDGVPFTADDILFWYNDVLLNEELIPAIDPAWKAGDKVVEVKKLDDYTIQFKFAETQPFFLAWPLSKASQHFRLFKAKHHLKQFHPNYTPREELDKKVKEAGLDHWFELFWNEATEYCALSAVPGAPVLTSYIPIEVTSSRHIYERNPYYWKVDTAGNQLPYIDRIEVTIVTDSEVAQGMMIGGQIDFNGFLTTMKNYPMYKGNEEKGGYRVVLWDSGKGGEVFFFFNLTHEDPVLRKIFRDVRFRRAMSLAINREEVNDFLYFGKATARQYTALPTCKYFEPEFANAYIEYSPEKAKGLLDEMGLTDTDGDGWRERPDGKKLTFTTEFTVAEDPLKLDTVELATAYWREIGIDAKAKLISGELANQRGEANLIDVGIWHGGWEIGILFPATNPWVAGNAVGIWPRFIDKWYQGEEIEQTIPEEVKQLKGLYEKVLMTPEDEEITELCKKFLRLQAENLWIIGVVGLAPHPLIINEHLRNVPEDGHWCWETQWMTTREPEQFFFEK